MMPMRLIVLIAKHVVALVATHYIPFPVARTTKSYCNSGCKKPTGAALFADGRGGSKSERQRYTEQAAEAIIDSPLLSIVEW